MKINKNTEKPKKRPERKKPLSPDKDMDILDHIEKIVAISKELGIDNCLSQADGKKHFDYITGKLGISPLQAVIFSHFLERSSDNNIQISDIADSIKCSRIRLIKYSKDCEELEKIKLIRSRKENGDTYYRIPYDVRESLRKFNEYIPEKNEDLSIGKFLSLVEKIFEEKSNRELTYNTLKMELLDLINLNMHLNLCRKIKSYHLDEDDTVLLLCFCHLFVNNDDDYIRIHDIQFVYDEGIDVHEIKRSLSNGYNELICDKLIEYNNNYGFSDSETWKLSDLSKKELLSEIGVRENKKFEKNLVPYDSIKPKKMYYNSRESSEIQKLASLLSNENYRKIQDRLDGKGMRKGFACIFSGLPGTGKTETAYQLALGTRRNLMKVDISETKSCWYGESEKRIKAIFDNYRSAVENSEIAPILLMNEADAVIGKRRESATGPLDQTENTIQNIILEEMENLSGILIATTNLTQNMDSAFERRFLYKITFDKPGPESRVNIWNTLLPDLSGDTVSKLAGKFELSGGQIENIARKAEVDSIVNGNSLSLDTLLQYCTDESHNSFNSIKKIGFGK